MSGFAKVPLLFPPLLFLLFLVPPAPPSLFTLLLSSPPFTLNPTKTRSSHTFILALTHSLTPTYFRTSHYSLPFLHITTTTTTLQQQICHWQQSSEQQSSPRCLVPARPSSPSYVSPPYVFFWLYVCKRSCLQQNNIIVVQESKDEGMHGREPDKLIKVYLFFSFSLFSTLLVFSSFSGPFLSSRDILDHIHHQPNDKRQI